MKTVLITGASSGIGAATAKKFLSEGWHVGLLARSADKLEALAQGYDNAVLLPADVTDESAVQEATAALVEISGRLDCLFNNAGKFGPAASLDEIELGDWRSTMELNITGMFIATKAAFGQMRRQTLQGGRIINNGSLSAHAPRTATSAAYTTSKHAISGLTKTITMDGRAYDIACGQIDIGNAATPLVQDLTHKAQQAGEEVLSTMDVSHCADAVWHMANLPLSANVQEMNIMATKMPYVGRG